MRPDTVRWGSAGLVGAGVALGVGELAAGLFTAIPSPLAAVGGAVVDGAPPWLEDFAISTFGTAGKTPPPPRGWGGRLLPPAASWGWSPESASRMPMRPPSSGPRSSRWPPG